MTPHQIDFKSARVGAILNTASGSCDATSAPKLLEIFASLEFPEPQVWSGGAEYMEEAFSAALSASLDVLIVLGGDGTIRTGAEACTPQGPLLIALPGGTMNVLPKALYGTRDWQTALTETLQQPKILNVSGGKIGNKQFFIAAILGAPALWAQARESLREGNLGEVLDNSVVAIQNMFRNNVTYEFTDKNKGEAAAVTVICPLISEVLPNTERSLEAAVIQVENAGEVLGLASTAAFGKWRDDEHVTTYTTKSVRVTSEQEVPLILDGETMHLGKDIHIEFVPVAFCAIIPQSLSTK